VVDQAPSVRTKLLIGSDYREAETGRTFDRLNPLSGAVATTSSAANAADANAAV